MTEPTPAEPDPRAEPPAPLQVDTLRIVEIGIACWALALVAVLAVPALRTGERDWWLWVPVAGLGLGALGWAYLRRGRGNAADA